MPSFAATITIAPITTHCVVATDRASRVPVNSSTVSGRPAHKRDPSHVQRSRAITPATAGDPLFTTIVCGKLQTVDRGSPTSVASSSILGIRTPDLLRVKRVVGFFCFPDFYPVLITFNNLGNLLFARSATPVVVGDRVLIRFPFHVVPNNATIIPAKDPKDRFLVIATASFLSRSAALPLSASYSMVASKIASCSQDAYNRHIWAGSWK
jgi:hypothetical protein